MALSIRSTPLLLAFLCFLATAASAQPRCIINVNLVNHNRYVYQSAEECGRFFHTSPWGNWGVNSNVGTRRDTDQFKGWRQPCAQTKVEWNSCTTRSRFRTSAYLNFPNSLVAYPYPANGYPFTDPFAWNDLVPPHGNSYYVDQHSPCGPSIYGSFQLVLAVSARRDTDNDGIADAGGCADLNGQPLNLRQNFMTVYELDTPDSDDLVESLYFPDLAVVLRCTPEGCVAVDDNDLDGWPDDVNDHASSKYQWPILYQDNRDVICRPGDPGVSCKRIDATVRIGSVLGYYFGF
jgi:hypothetical protein